MVRITRTIACAVVLFACGCSGKSTGADPKPVPDAGTGAPNEGGSTLPHRDADAAEPDVVEGPIPPASEAGGEGGYLDASPVVSERADSAVIPDATMVDAGADALFASRNDAAEPDASAGQADPSVARLVFFQPLPPISSPSDLKPTDTWSSYIGARVASADGAVLAGASFFSLNRPVPFEGAQAIVWTEAGGVVGLGTLPGTEQLVMEPRHVTNGADAVLGVYSTGRSGPGAVLPGGAVHVQSFTGFFRWTKAGGLARLGEPDGMESGELDQFTADGKTALGWFEAPGQARVPFRWTESGGLRRLPTVPGWPADAYVSGLSSDGNIIVGTVSGQRPFRFSDATGATYLGELAGYPTCSVKFVSSAATVIVGTCEAADDTQASRGYRWTAETGMVAVEPPANSGATFVPSMLSGEGSLIAGLATTGGGFMARLASFTVASGVQMYDLPAGASTARASVPYWSFLSGDGRVGFGTFHSTATRDFPNQIEPGTRAFRWTPERGVVALPPLPGHDVSYPFAASREGAIAGGSSFLFSLTQTPIEAVVWDERGVRNVESELAAAGVALGGARLEGIDQVLVQGSTIRLRGSGITSGARREWVAWLGVRR